MKLNWRSNFSFFGLLFLNLIAFGQKPEISSVSPLTSAMGTEITILGTGFSSNSSDLKVHFGGMDGTIVEARENYLLVTAPSGATFRSISVTNLASGLTGYAPSPFLLSYSGNNFDANAIDAPADFPSENELYDLAIDDFNGDGKLDIVTANNNSNLINIYTNQSTVGSVSFSNQLVAINSNTINVNTRDLNGDGKPEILISKSGNPGDRIYYLQNTSSLATVTFAAPQFLLVDGNIAKKIEIEDLDKDGLPDLIVSNQAGNKLSIFKNTSSGGTISFNPLRVLEIVDPANPSLQLSGLTVKDFNGDNFPDIAVIPFLDKNIYLVPNTSQVGSIDFGTTQIINVSGNLAAIASADLNEDGKQDLIASKLLQNQVSIFLNNGTGSSISFASEAVFSVNDRPWGLALGDVNGDGLVDIGVASVNAADKKLTILENQSVSGSLAFNTSYITTPEIVRNLAIGDMDTDGKPDFILTSLGSSTFDVTVLRNKNCFIPVMEPSETSNFCIGAQITLTATPNEGSVYTWKRSDGMTLGTGPSPFYQFAATAGTFDYYVESSSEGGSCVNTSNATTISVSSGTIPNPPTIIDPPTICEGDDITLTIDPGTIVGGATYEWGLPDGSTAAGQTLSLTNVTISDAGSYTLSAFDGGCNSSIDETILEITPPPDIAVVSDDNLNFCSTNSITLKVTSDPSYTYKWFKNSAEIGGEVSSTLIVSTTGDYFAEVTNSINCAIVSNTVTATAASIPVANFTNPGTGCIQTPLTFTNTSSSQSGVTAFYDWDFGDGNSSTEESPTHTYATANSYSVSLSISYGDASCSDQISQNISITSPTPISIEADRTEFCTGETAELSVTGTFTSILWSTNEITETITVSASGTYSVTVTLADGCQSTASIDITAFNLPNIQVSPVEPSLERGDSIQLIASGALTYVWSPVETLSDPNIADPLAFPEETTIYTVSGVDVNNCTGTTEVTLIVTVAEPKLKAEAMFSPNSDGVDDVWRIDNIADCINCIVTVFNRAGQIVYEQENYNDDWDGRSNGTDLAEGAYYFIVRDGSSQIKSGSVSIIR